MTLGAARFMLFGGRVARGVVLTTAAIAMAAPDPGMQQGARVVLSDAALVRVLNGDPVLPTSLVGLGSSLIAMTAPDPAIGFTSLALDSATAVATAPNPTAQAGGDAWTNGYARRRTLIVPPSVVAGGADLNSFPMLFRETRQSLRATASGGALLATGYDLRFEDLSGFKSGHEREVWTASTGELLAWLNVPTLSASVNTRQQLFYGKADQTTDEASAASVWGGYALVANCLTGADRTGQGRSLTVTGVSSEVPDSTDWWALPRRSGRAWASGVAYWMGLDNSATNPDIDAEEADVALIDAGTGTSRSRGAYSVPSDRTSNVADWNGVIGGAVTAAMNTTNTQMDTNPNVLFGIGDIIKQLPRDVAGGSGWIDWVLQTIPDSLDTNSGANETAWDQIIAGTHDAKFMKLGERLVAKAAAVGHPISRFLFDLNREMNDPDNVYGIQPGSRLKYKQAIERTIDKMREGAGVRLRFVHRPAWKHNIGDYAGWAPSNVDVLSLSIHPDNDVVSNSDITKMFNGTLSTSFYGINHLLAASDSMGLPIAFPEWSPRFEAGKACPVAKTFIERFYDDVLTPNKDRLVCECIYKENVRQTGTGAYKGGDSPGLTQWNDMVARRKTLWSGTKST